MRNVFTIVGLSLLFVGAVLVFVFTQNPDFQKVHTNAVPATALVPFVSLAKGAHSKVGDRVNYVIKSQSEMTELWNLLDVSGTPPVIDFNTQVVIAVFAGQKSAENHAIMVSKIEDVEKRVVSIKLEGPDGTCVSKGVSTAPYEIVAVKATTLPLVHQDIQTVTTCLE